jgi:hypothetical protein
VRKLGQASASFGKLEFFSELLSPSPFFRSRQ